MLDPLGEPKDAKGGPEGAKSRLFDVLWPNWGGTWPLRGAQASFWNLNGTKNDQHRPPKCRKSIPGALGCGLDRARLGQIRSKIHPKRCRRRLKSPKREQKGRSKRTNIGKIKMGAKDGGGRRANHPLPQSLITWSPALLLSHVFLTPLLWGDPQP
jgi:hypothetical protein